MGLQRMSHQTDNPTTVDITNTDQMVVAQTKIAMEAFSKALR